MPEDDLSDSESAGRGEDSSSDSEGPVAETPAKGKISHYEKERLKRIEENRALIEALGLRQMANSFASSIQKPLKKKSDKKGKKKLIDDDEDYDPSEAEEHKSGSSGEEDRHDSGGEDYRGARQRKIKKKMTTPRKKASRKRFSCSPEYIDEDDEELIQAIALSLQASAAGVKKKLFSEKLCGNASHTTESSIEVVQPSSQEVRKGKRQKSIINRNQMTEDEFIQHFFQFDEVGKGGISLRDLHRMASAHDFTWSDEEMAHMIHCFDSDQDGKLNLEDFRKIVIRCNLLKNEDPTVTGKA